VLEAAVAAEGVDPLHLRRRDVRLVDVVQQLLQVRRVDRAEGAEELDAARGEDFDRLFLTFMIQHHKGAVSMVRELFAARGAGQDETVIKFVSDVEVDQTTEINRMLEMLFALGSTSPSPPRRP
jgi:uncharacterized protein (DUF305 family)